jgi:putative ABC transport system ATP-binding protein
MSTPNHADPVLRIDHVSKAYPGEPPTIALSDVSLDVHAGELVAIVGPSGSGKSTLLGIMGTLERATSGRMLLRGQDVTTLSDTALSGLRSEAIGFVFQQFFLLDGLSAWENVAQGMLYQGVGAAERRRRAVDALESVGLGHRLTHRPSQLSGGERQRVAIARAVVGRPAIVLADEPTGSLDSVAGTEILEILRELNRSGTTIAVITHSEPVAEATGRQIRILDGRVVEPMAAGAATPVVQ